MQWLRMGRKPIRLRRVAKSRAARIGPTVWALEGPMPILNTSKKLVGMVFLFHGACVSSQGVVPGLKRGSNGSRHSTVIGDVPGHGARTRLCEVSGHLNWLTNLKPGFTRACSRFRAEAHVA